MGTVALADTEKLHLVAHYHEDGSFTYLEGTIDGPPIPKPSPRASRLGHIYNPLRRRMGEAREEIKNLLVAEGLTSDGTSSLFNKNSLIFLEAHH